MRAHSSGIKFSPAIKNSIKEGALNVTISIDSSCPETYKRIKRVDCYDKVVENIKKYAQANAEGYGLVTSKYIIIPHINDNIREIENWIQQTKQFGSRWLALDIEDVWYKMNRNHIPDYLPRIKNFRKELKQTKPILFLQVLKDIKVGQDCLNLYKTLQKLCVDRQFVYVVIDCIKALDGLSLPEEIYSLQLPFPEGETNVFSKAFYESPAGSQFEQDIADFITNIIINEFAMNPVKYL